MITLMRKQRTWLAAHAACIVLTASGLALASCDTDKERIAAQNDAARTAAAGGTPPTPRESRSGSIDVFDLRVGDCLARDDVFVAQTGESDQVEVVDCETDDAFGLVWKLDVIVGRDGDEHPGDDAVIALAEQACATPGAPSTFRFPSSGSWEVGDRAITCIRLVGFDYQVGTCIADESERHHIVACDGGAVFGEVAGIVDLSAEYPPGAPLLATNEFDALADARCPLEANYFLYPDVQRTWDAGYRLLTCVVMR